MNNMEQLEKQEIYCHSCGKYVQFNIDISLNGNHVLECPNCGHEHCRVVNDGKITDVRWGSRNKNLQTFFVNTLSITTSSTSTYDTYTNTGCTTSNNFTYTSWMNAMS